MKDAAFDALMAAFAALHQLSEQQRIEIVRLNEQISNIKPITDRPDCRECLKNDNRRDGV